MAMTYGSLAKAHSWGKLRIFPALGVKEGVGHNYGVSTMALGSEFTLESYRIKNEGRKKAWDLFGGEVWGPRGGRVCGGTFKAGVTGRNTSANTIWG